MTFWIACDTRGVQWLYKDKKPELSEYGNWYNGIPVSKLPRNTIDGLKFGDEPVEFMQKP